MCGFSSTAVAILVESGVYFESVDILLDEEVRQ
jgi:glutaredoxin-related protein